MSPWLVSPLVLSSNRTFTVSYVHHIILFPKNLTCTDWTTLIGLQQSPSSLDRPSQMHTSAVFLTPVRDIHICSLGLHLLLMVVLVQNLALVRRGVAVDLPGVVGKQVGSLQWWLNHLLGAGES